MLGVSPQMQISRLIGGNSIDVGLSGARTIGDVRGRVADFVGVHSSRIELVPFGADWLLENNAVLECLPPECCHLQVVTLPPHGMSLPEERLAEIRAQLRAASTQNNQDLANASGLPENVIAEVQAAVDPDLGMVGDPPYIPFCVTAIGCVPGVPNSGFLGSLSCSKSVGEISVLLCKALEVPQGSVALTYEGRDIDPDGTAKDNGVHLPGPAARRAGAKWEIKFVLRNGVLPNFLKRAADEHAMRAGESEWQMFCKEYRRVSQNIPKIPATITLPNWWRTDGTSSRFSAAPEVCEAVQKILDAGHGTMRTKVTAVLVNEDAILWERYQARKASMHPAGVLSVLDGSHCDSVKSRTNFMTENGGVLGDTDLSLNEFLLFRGVDPGDLDCLNHDMQVPDNGLHFSDNTRIASCGTFSRHLGAMHGCVSTLLICRVLCGGQYLMEFTSAPTSATLRDCKRNCAEVSCNSVVYRVERGGNRNGRTRARWADAGVANAYVFSLDQVYPAYVAFYRDSTNATDAEGQRYGE